MTEPTDLEHVNPHRRCGASTVRSGPCKAMTNYVCVRCRQPLCGRHSGSHRCKPAGGAS